jgi:tetratricopeptide (TPR) repeat protein
MPHVDLSEATCLDGTLDGVALLKEVARVDTEGLDVSDDVMSDGVPASAALSWILNRDPSGRVTERAGSRRIARRDIAALKTAAGMFMQLDYLYGGGHGRRALRHYVRHEALPLLDGVCSDDVRTEMYAAVGEVTELLGWTAYDVGDHVTARRYFLGTLQLAQVAGDRLLGSRILASMSHQANYLGRYSLALQLARAAQEGARGQATPRAMAMFAVHEARALASLGDEAGLCRAMRSAEDHLSRASGQDDPSWLTYFDGPELLGEFAHCFRDLGRPLLAIEHATAAVEQADASYARTLAFVRMVLASAQFQRGDLDQALDTASLTIEAAQPLQSARVVRYLTDFERALPEKGAAVVRFRGRVAAALDAATN